MVGLKFLAPFGGAIWLRRNCEYVRRVARLSLPLASKYGPKSKRGNSNAYEYRQQQAEWIRFVADRDLDLTFSLSSGNACAISAGI